MQDKIPINQTGVIGMKKIFKPRTIFIIACVCLLAVSLFQLGLRFKDYASEESSSSQMEDLFGITGASSADTPPVLPSSDNTDNDMNTDTDADTNPLIDDALSYFEGCDFDALLSVNDEIIGWIVIPGTNISYPICQHEDNQYYLEHTSQRESNLVGAIFADYRVKEPFEEFNTILYGHRLLNQTMFSALKTYVEKDVWEQNPYIYICTPGTIYVYEIYAAFRGDPDGISYDTGIHSEEKKQSFIDYSLSCAEYDTGIVPTTEDSFLTLSTCTGTGHTQRMIIHSVLVATNK